MYALVLNRRGNHTYSYEYAVGLFYFANRLEQLGLPFRFCRSPFEVKDNEITCFSSLLTDHTSIFNIKASRIIVGGIGAHANIITAVPNVLQISGASTNITEDHIKYSTGLISIESVPNNIEIPTIPPDIQKYLKIIQLNCGSGCFYRKCLFCDRSMAVVADPELTALNICEIFKKYHCSVQLGIDGPSRNYLHRIAEELIRLQPTYGKVRWACNIRADDASNYNNLRFLVRSGLYSIGIGIEYLCDDVLQTIAKGISLKDIFEALNNGMKLDLYLHFCLIDFDPFVTKDHKEIHRYYLQKILAYRYPKISLSISTLSSNADLDIALTKLRVG